MSDYEKVPASELAVGDVVFSTSHTVNGVFQDIVVREIKTTFDGFVTLNPGTPEQQMGRSSQLINRRITPVRPDEETTP